MDDLRASFDEERYPHRYLLDVPDRQGRQVFDTIESFIADQGLDARVTYRNNTDNGTLSWDIGIATADEGTYAAITRHLDRAVHGWVMEHIDATYGAGHPLNRYIRQLERIHMDPDALAAATADLTATIETQRRDAIETANQEFEAVRAQWADPQAEAHLLLE